MSIKTVTHINFRGNAREALAFYQSVFGGQITQITFKDAGVTQDPVAGDQIMWGQVASDAGFHVMAFDVPATTPWEQGENAYFIAVGGTSPEEITGYWQKLSENATIRQSLAPAPWAPLYGQLKDQFGVVWVLNVAAPQAQR